MKKFFAAILTVFLSLGLLTACEGGRSMAPLSRRPFKALKDQIQEVQINQKAASGRIKSTQIPSLFPKTVNNPTQKVRAARKSM